MVDLWLIYGNTFDGGRVDGLLYNYSFSEDIQLISRYIRDDILSTINAICLVFGLSSVYLGLFGLNIEGTFTQLLPQCGGIPDFQTQFILTSKDQQIDILVGG